MQEFTVFYSWQSDLPNSTNRTFIEDCLGKALKALTGSAAIAISCALDRDTRGVPGSPSIAETILNKIRRASVFVADVSIVIPGLRPTPNPNVMLETGYALAALGDERVITVFNSAFGDVEDLPFDLRFRRAVAYDLPQNINDKASIRQYLTRALKDALRLSTEHLLPALRSAAHLPEPRLSIRQAESASFFPERIELSNAQSLWLRLLAEEFNSGVRTRPYLLRRRHPDALLDNFDAGSIDPRLMRYARNNSPERYDITLLGLWHVDSSTPWIWKCHLFLSYIQQLVSHDVRTDVLFVHHIAAKLGLTAWDVSCILHLCPGHSFGSAGGSQSEHHYLTEFTTLSVGSEGSFRFYESYTSVDRLM